MKNSNTKTIYCPPQTEVFSFQCEGAFCQSPDPLTIQSLANFNDLGDIDPETFFE